MSTDRRLPLKYRAPVLGIIAVVAVSICGTDSSLRLLAAAVAGGVLLAIVERWMLRRGFDR